MMGQGVTCDRDSRGLKKKKKKGTQRDVCHINNYNRDVCHLLHSRTLSLSLSLSLSIYIYIYTHIDVLAIDEIKQALHSLNVPLLSRQEGEYRKVKGGGLWHTSKPMLVF
jgi:Holliday junction resolvase RusA-like endonuclease